jgi:GAF domain-containing protein
MTTNFDRLRLLQQENSRLKEENHAQRESLLRMQHALRALSSIQQGLDEITAESNALLLVEGILSAALRAVDAEEGSLQLLDEEKKELVFVEVQGASREKLRGYRMKADLGVAGWVASNRKAELVPDVRLEPRFTPVVDQAIGFHTTSLICVPLLDGERTLGVIEAVNPRGERPFTQQDLDIFLLVAHLASLALVKAEGASAGDGAAGGGPEASEGGVDANPGA